MKKSAFKALVSILTAMLFLFFAVACSNGGGSSGSDGGNAGDGSQSAAPMKLKVSFMSSPEHILYKNVLEPFSKEVAEKTNGRVQFEIYPGGALNAPPETFDAIVTGIADAGWVIDGYTPGQFPIHSILNMPFMTSGTAVDISVVMQRLYEQFPEIQKEYEKVKPMWFFSADEYVILTKKKPIRTFEDIKGLKIRAVSPESVEMLKAWGAIPVSMPATDTYDALQKGVIDGTLSSISQIQDFNLYDVVNYLTHGHYVNSVMHISINKNSWNKLSPEDQKIIEDMIGEKMSVKTGEAFEYQASEALKKGKEKGMEEITLPDAELQKFKDATKPLIEQWIADVTSKGADGKKIYETTLQLFAERK